VFFDGDVRSGTTYCAELETYGGDIRIAVRDSVCRSERGLRLRLDVKAGATPSTSFVIERSRFEPSPPGNTWTHGSIELLLNGPDTGALGAGSKASAIIRNNEFVRTHLEGIYLVPGLPLQAADQAAAQVVIANNTFVSDDQQYFIWDNGQAGRFPVV